MAKRRMQEMKSVLSKRESVMSYILAMYDPPLQDGEIMTLSGLCNDAEVQPLNKSENELLVYAYDYTFGGEYSGAFYRLSTESLTPSMFLFGKQPVYMGQFNTVNEERCIELAAFCRHLGTGMLALERMSRDTKECSESAQRLIGKKNEIGWMKIHEVVQQFGLAFAAGHTKLERIFKRQRYKFSI